MLKNIQVELLFTNQSVVVEVMAAAMVLIVLMKEERVYRWDNMKAIGGE